MGNEVGSFKNCTLETPYNTSNTFSVYGGYTNDGTDITVFVYTENEDDSYDVVENSAKYLKTLKHPGIVKLLGVDKSQDETWLVTEHVKPLEAVIDSLSHEEICAGLYDIIQVMTFIHEKARLCHNSLSMSSIFVADGGAWKIAGLQCMCAFDKATSAVLSRMKNCRPQLCIAPEEKKGYKINKELGHARDSYAFGHLAEQLLELLPKNVDETKTFELRIQDECLSEDPRQRPQFSSFLNDQLFKSDFVYILNFLRTLTIRGEVEKQEFFRSLVPKLLNLPANLVASRLVRPLLARFVLLEQEAVDHVVPHLLTPCDERDEVAVFKSGERNPILPESLFKQYIIPEIIKIFHVRDVSIRVILLRHFRCYCGLIETSLLKAVVLPQILLGLRDVNDELAEWSIRALADLVPILGGASVISPHRTRLFTRLVPHFKKKPDPTSAVVNGGPKSTPVKAADLKVTDRSPSKSVAREEERERRREEARRRAEERRVKREQRKKHPQKAQIVEGDSPVAKTIESDDGGPIDINKKKSESLGNDDVAQEANQSEEASQHSDDLDPDKFDNSFERTESDIDFEIEQELNAMESTLPENKLQKIHSQSPTTCDTKIDSALDVKVDWSDISKNSQTVQAVDKIAKKGVLKLKSPLKTKLSPPPSESVSLDTANPDSSVTSANDSSNTRNRKQSNEMDDWGNSWDDIQPESNISSPVSPKSPSHPKSPQTTSAVRTPQRASNKKSKFNRQTGPPRVQDNFDIYDIKSMDVNKFKGKGAKEEDFFADMGVTYKAQSDNLLDMLSQKSEKATKKSDKAEPRAVSSLSFAVQDTGDTDAAGGWENEDFDW